MCDCFVRAGALRVMVCVSDCFVRAVRCESDGVCFRPLCQGWGFESDGVSVCFQIALSGIMYSGSKEAINMDRCVVVFPCQYLCVCVGEREVCVCERHTHIHTHIQQ